MKRIIYGSLSVLTAIGTVFAAAKAEVLGGENVQPQTSQQLVQLPAPGVEPTVESSAADADEVDAAPAVVAPVVTPEATSQPLPGPGMAAPGTRGPVIQLDAQSGDVPVPANGATPGSSVESPAGPTSVPGAAPLEGATPLGEEDDLEEEGDSEDDAGMEAAPFEAGPTGDDPVDEGMPEGDMSDDGMSEDGMSEDGMIDDGMPEDDMIDDGMPEDGMIDDGITDDGMPDDGMPEDDMPDDGMPEDGVPEDEVPEADSFGDEDIEGDMSPDAAPPGGPFSPVPGGVTPGAPNSPPNGVTPGAPPAGVTPGVPPAGTPAPAAPITPLSPTPDAPLEQPLEQLPPDGGDDFQQSAPLGSSSDRLIGEGFTPFQLSYLAVGGGLQEAGIPGGNLLLNAYEAGEISAADVVEAGAMTQRLGTAAADQDGYTTGVDRILQLLSHDGLSS